MSDQATAPGRTGRRRGGGEPAPSQVQPEEESELGEDEAEVGAGVGGVYFTKANKKALWHVFDGDDNAVARVWMADSGRWHVKIGLDTIQLDFGSAPAARAFVSGWAYGGGLNPPTAMRAGDPGTSAERTGAGTNIPQPPAGAGRSEHQGRPVSDGTASSSTTGGGVVGTEPATRG